MAAGKNEARVTQAIRNVQLLAPNAAPRPASINDNVRSGHSRANRQRFARGAYLHGSNVGAARREQRPQLRRRRVRFGEWQHVAVPAEKFRGRRINTAVATAAGAGFTAMAEYRPKSWIKFIILEGQAIVSLKHHPGETRALRAGQMLIVRAGATKLPEPQDVDLSELIKTSLLVTGFPRLPNLNLILAEANNQQILPPSSRVIDPTGLNTRDQRAAATERERPPKPRSNR